jgi:hypothetical protein
MSSHRIKISGEIMERWLFKAAALTALAFLACSAQSNPLLPVQNLTFTNFGPGGCAPKAIFSSTNVIGWTGGTGLISIDAPGTATVAGACGNAYPVWGPFADPPPGGNFIQADGNPVFETSFNQTITGLTPGQDYDLSFWQAAGQQFGFTGDTTEQWKVFFGSGSFAVDCGTNPCSIITSGSIQEIDSALMSTPSGGVSAWNLVTLTVKADAASDVLSFLAWGDGGNTTNLPPTVFLAGVNTPANVPEPPTLALFALVLVGFSASRLRRSAKRIAEA